MFVNKFFSRNRDMLAKQLTDHFVVISANSLLQSSADLHFPFRQDSNFWYLTGIDEPDAVLVIDTQKDHTTLLLRPKNTYQKEWDGDDDLHAHEKTSGISNFGSIKGLPALLKDAKKRGLKIGYLKPFDTIVQPFGFYSNPARKRLESAIKRVVSEPVDIRITLARMRAVKQPEELAEIKRALEVTSMTVADVTGRLASFKNEKDVERAITAGFYLNGGDGHGFEPIVAAGANAATLHYMANNESLNGKNMLLIDIGAQTGRYVADITRVLKLDTPTHREREVYDTVLQLQADLLAMIQPGLSMRDNHKSAQSMTIDAMKKLGVSDPEKRPQGFGHFLGIDTHDAGDYSAPLKPGTVITVEPGIYLSDEGIGVRIEDDVLITETGTEVLSKDIPKSL